MIQAFWEKVSAFETIEAIEATEAIEEISWKYLIMFFLLCFSTKYPDDRHFTIQTLTTIVHLMKIFIRSVRQTKILITFPKIPLFIPVARSIARTLCIAEKSVTSSFRWCMVVRVNWRLFPLKIATESGENEEFLSKFFNNSQCFLPTTAISKRQTDRPDIKCLFNTLLQWTPVVIVTHQ